ncbi:MAG: DUF4350 domain-containing protein [Myxococcota bacterium]|nr:DUF4350 domain-containing protein [Myxococcota bacterium]MDW8363787.1 DUF4350 domain-containing protein [Myxococcales bacterium]
MAAPRSARANDDFDPRGRGWNGLSELVSLAADAGVRLRIAERRLDVGTLEADDGLFVVHPRRRLPVGALDAMLRAGGRIVLADDFGRGDALLARYRIERGRPRGARALRLRDRPALLLAQPTGRSPLTDGVRVGVLTNRPAVVRHRALRPLLRLEADEGVLLTGSVGRGRLAVLSDPSVLVNGMLALSDNRRLARALLAWAGAGSGRVVLAPPNATIHGRFGEPGAPLPPDAIGAWLDELSRATPPAGAMQALAAVVAILALLVAAGSLSRRSPYRAEALLPPAAGGGGIGGRWEALVRWRGSWLGPLLLYRHELEAEIARRIGRAGGRWTLRDLVEALRARGDEALASQGRALWLWLDELERAQDLPPGAPWVGRRAFARAVALGERILRCLGESP